jgi:hypothetical protein
MFLDLGQGVALTDEQFQTEMWKRRQISKDDVILGCPLCNQAQPPKAPTSLQQQQ